MGKLKQNIMKISDKIVAKSKNTYGEGQAEMIDKRKRLFQGLYFLSAAVILLCPLRHIGVGVDLWDGGYNYANFAYSGPEYMDSMWYFATWISNLYGSFLTHLPLGNSMWGMNLYTSLTVGVIAAAAYVFCTKKLSIPPWLAFFAELIALSLCWAPSAILYNYLTYGFFLAAVLLIHQGLVKDRLSHLALAGVILGLNVGVRFPNLVHAGLIFAVWYDAFLTRKKLPRVLRETFICILGYAAGCGLFLLPIALLYGLDSYAGGIMRLFAMTETAADYRVGAMLRSLVRPYLDAEVTYWLKRFALLFAVTLGICLILPEKWRRAKKITTGVLTLLFVYLIARKGFCSGNYRQYDAIYMPCVFLLGMTILLSVFQIADRRADRERKLSAVLVLLTLLLSGLGSNNYIYSNINNLFFVLPCSFWMFFCFLREKERSFYFSFQATALALILLLTAQALPFGWNFVYEEASGAEDPSCLITDIPVLKGMHTEQARAVQLQSLYQYLRENGLADRECLLYGNIPGLAYYMELSPAINIWSDLRSYSLSAMREDLDQLTGKCSSGEELPLVILDAQWAGYLEEPTEAADYWDQSAVEKFGLLKSFMETFSYEKIYDDNTFIIFFPNPLDIY